MSPQDGKRYQFVNGHPRIPWLSVYNYIACCDLTNPKRWLKPNIGDIITEDSAQKAVLDVTKASDLHQKSTEHP